MKGGFTSAEPEKHVFVRNFVEKVNIIPSLSAERKKQLITQVIAQVTKVVYPAYQSITKATEKLLTKARNEAGIWAQPNGEAYYQEAIIQLGNSSLTADEIHKIGLDEVTRISKQMDSILSSQGYKEGTVGERMIALTEEPRFLYDDSKAGARSTA